MKFYTTKSGISLDLEHVLAVGRAAPWTSGTEAPCGYRVELAFGTHIWVGTERGYGLDAWTQEKAEACRADLLAALEAHRAGTQSAVQPAVAGRFFEVGGYIVSKSQTPGKVNIFAPTGEGGQFGVDLFAAAVGKFFCEHF